MDADPTARVDMVKVATPLPFRVPVPSDELPFLKVTVPVGTPLPGAAAVTVAVNLIDWLYTEGLTDELTAVLVLDVFTTCGGAFPLLPTHPLAPVKVAV